MAKKPLMNHQSLTRTSRFSNSAICPVSHTVQAYEVLCFTSIFLVYSIFGAYFPMFIQFFLFYLVQSIRAGGETRIPHQFQSEGDKNHIPVQISQLLLQRSLFLE